MLKVLIVGCGDLGHALAQQLLAQGHQVLGVRRSPQQAAYPTLVADVTQPSTLQALAEVAADIIVYCVSAGAQTDSAYQAAYVDGLANVLDSQASNTALKHVFFVSSTRVYGQVGDEVLDEISPALAVDFGGERLLQAERLLNQLPCGHTVLRLSGIYATGRLYLVNMARNPANWPAHNSWTNRIHRDDAAAFIGFLCQTIMKNKMIESLYIVTDSAPVSQREVLLWMAQQMGIEANTSMLAPTSGKRLSNARMLATGFVLQYPNYQAGYAPIIAGLAS